MPRPRSSSLGILECYCSWRGERICSVPKSRFEKDRFRAQSAHLQGEHMISARRASLLAFSFLVGSGLLFAQGGGNDSGDNDISSVPTLGPLEPPALLDEILNAAEIMDPVATGAIRTAISSGKVNVVQHCDPQRPGSHDKNTIALSPITTRNNNKIGYYPAWMCGTALLHEWKHIKNIPPDAPPSTEDPTTNPETNPSCAACAHADMTATDLINMATLSCQEDPPPCVEFCVLYCSTLDRGKGLWNECQGASPPCPGVSPDETFHSKITSFPCCTCTCPG